MRNSITCPRCAKSWRGLKAEHCTVCHETFTGTSAADAHRVGRHGVTEGTDRRRCLPVDEVKIRRHKNGPYYGLKWNERVQAWGWDEPRAAFSEHGARSNRGREHVPGTEYQGGGLTPTLDAPYTLTGRAA